MDARGRLSVVNLLKRRAPLVASVILLLQAAAYYSLSSAEVTPEIGSWREFPAAIASWRMVEQISASPETLERLRPDDYLDRVYVKGATPTTIELFVAYFRTLRKGRAPHSPQACLPGTGWRSVSVDIASVQAPERDAPFPVNLYVVEKESSRLLVLYWYQLAGRAFTNYESAQFNVMPQVFLHGRTDIALIRLIIPIGGEGLGAAQKTALDFAHEVYPLVLARMR